MRMQVRAWSLWLAYTLKDTSFVRDRLPSDLEMASLPLLGDETSRFPSAKLLFNAYEVDSPWMHGRRVETVVATRHKRTKETRLVVLDCLSDTLRWDPVDGVQRANAYTRSFGRGKGRSFSVDVRNSQDRFVVDGRVGASRPIDWRFAVEGNRECYFGGHGEAFNLTFNETLVALPVRHVELVSVENTLWQGVRTSAPSHAFVHPHPMEFHVHVDRFG